MENFADILNGLRGGIERPREMNEAMEQALVLLEVHGVARLLKASSIVQSFISQDVVFREKNGSRREIG